MRAAAELCVFGYMHTFKLGISHTTPFPTAVAHTSTSHHVTKDIMSLVPLVSNTVHHPFTGCAHFFMS